MAIQLEVTEEKLELITLIIVLGMLMYLLRVFGSYFLKTQPLGIGLSEFYKSQPKRSLRSC